MIALSTLWNADKHNDGRSLVLEARALGFHSVELNYRITCSIMEDILEQVQQKQIQVTSLHNYTPIPQDMEKSQGGGDLFLLSSTDDLERQEAVAWTGQTIEWAARMGAGVVVLHLGRTGEDVSEQAALERELRMMIEKGNPSAGDLTHILQDMSRIRNDVKKPYLESVIRSLDELVEIASKLNVVLGIENRFRYNEIPVFEEIDMILDRFPPSVLGYWHDTGHAHIFERMGIASHRAYLESFSSRLIGVHLHDCMMFRDHISPGKGDVDFGLVASYLKTETLRVLELHQSTRAEDIITGLKQMEVSGII